MNLTVVSQTNEKMSFTLKDVSAAYANTLRRLMLNEVPTMAIEDVTIQKNDSVLYDEIIAHRLGLVVLKTDLNSYKLAKGERTASPEYELKLTLDVTGPKTVYASDLVSKDPAVTPVFPNTIIAKLGEEQQLQIEATAVLGIGREHMKWSPGLVWYYHEPTIKVNNKSKDLEQDKKKFPAQIFNDKGQIEAKNINTPSLIDACLGVNPDIVDITFDTSTFTFVVESFGALGAKEIVERALEVYNAQLDEFGELIGTMK